MIARVWRGWTEHRNADAYEQVFSAIVLPELGPIRRGLPVEGLMSDEVFYAFLEACRHELDRC
jgi:hypothetical protein